MNGKRITFFDVSDDNGDEVEFVFGEFGSGDAEYTGINVDLRPTPRDPDRAMGLAVYLNTAQLEKLRNEIGHWLARRPAPKKLWDEVTP